jgi:hypothetical protein
MARHLRREGYVMRRKRIRRLSLCVIYQRPGTNIPAADHEVFPYLLRDRNVGDIGAPHLIRPIDLEGCGGISRPGCHHGLREPQIIGPIRSTRSFASTR